MAFTLTSSKEQYVQPQNAVATDDALIARIARGDREALTTLYAHSGSAVYGFALSILKSKHEAEDITHDTYLKVLAAAGNYRPQGKPMAWVLTITRNLCLMRLREARNKDVPYDTGYEPGHTAHPGDQSTDRIVLKAALDILSDEERQIVILHSVSGLKHREIATLMQAPLSTILSRYRRALSKLKLHMKEEPRYDG